MNLFFFFCWYKMLPVISQCRICVLFGHYGPSACRSTAWLPLISAPSLALSRHCKFVVFHLSLIVECLWFCVFIFLSILCSFPPPYFSRPPFLRPHLRIYYLPSLSPSTFLRDVSLAYPRRCPPHISRPLTDQCHYWPCRLQGAFRLHPVTPARPRGFTRLHSLHQTHLEASGRAARRQPHLLRLLQPQWFQQVGTPHCCKTW